MAQTTIQELATRYLATFHTQRNDDGTPLTRDGVEVVSTDDENARSLAHDAHGDMFPDDWRYSFIVEALDLLSEHEEPDDARDAIESDIYTSDLLQWLGSRLDRLDYCDQYVDEIGDRSTASTLARISGGQYMERAEVFNSVLGNLMRESDESGDAE